MNDDDHEFQDFDVGDKITCVFNPVGQKIVVGTDYTVSKCWSEHRSWGEETFVAVVELPRANFFSYKFRLSKPKNPLELTLV